MTHYTSLFCSLLRSRAAKPFLTGRLVADDDKVESTIKKPIQRVQQLYAAPEISGFVQ